MNPDHPRRRLLLRAGLGGLVSPLALLGGRAQACEFWTPTLRVIHPWTHATGDDATTALVCMRFDEVRQDDRLVGVDTPVATGAELTGLGADAGPGINFAIPQGRETQLSQGGTCLRLLGLTMPLEVGRAYPMRLVFDRGGVLNADLTVDFARFV